MNLCQVIQNFQLINLFIDELTLQAQLKQKCLVANISVSPCTFPFTRTCTAAANVTKCQMPPWLLQRPVSTHCYTSYRYVRLWLVQIASRGVS